MENHMFVRAMTVGVAIMVFATSATAQERGTVEFGGFASNTSFDNSLGMNSAWGFGGRVGAFLHPRVSLEFEAGATSASRTLGLNDVNVGILSGRATAVPFKSGRVSVLVGAGVDHTDTYNIESYGVHGLVGAKIGLWNTGDLRIDGIQSYMVNGNGTNLGLHMGLSFYRNPLGRMRTVTRDVVGPSIMQRPDSVSAFETRRLRALEASYRSLRDSLARNTSYSTPSSAAALATMQEMIYFQADKAELSDSAKSILRDKLAVFRANPGMRIVITGFASQPGTDSYNMALGARRADAAKAYLVAMGIDPVRVEVATRGEGELVVEGPGELANAQNRRGQFRLLIANDHLVAPKR
jgi:peptidoglycan-associated lipoprotein